MVKTADIYYDGTKKDSKPVKCFRVLSCNSNFYETIDYIYVEEFRNGVAKISPSHETTIDDFAEIVAGLMQSDSNFVLAIRKNFKSKKNKKFVGIKFHFDGVSVLIKEQNINPEEIVEKWKKREEEERQKAERQHEEETSLKEFKKRRLG